MTKTLTELKVRLLAAREARDNATKVANTYLDQLADLSKKVERLQEQLKEANEVIESLRTYDFTVDDENAEYYQVKWNVEAKRFYKNKKWGIK